MEPISRTPKSESSLHVFCSIFCIDLLAIIDQDSTKDFWSLAISPSYKRFAFWANQSFAEASIWLPDACVFSLMITIFCTFSFFGTALQMKVQVRIQYNAWFWFMYSQKWNCAASLFPKQNYNVLSPNFHIDASVSDLYIPGSICLFCSQIGRQIRGIYKSLTDTWM